MYQAKHNRKGELEEFNRLLYEGNDVLLSGQEALNNLIDQSLIDYAMQPILCVKTGQVYGYEMLMRPRSRDFSGPRDVLRMAHSHAQLCRVERLTWFAAMQTFVNCVQIGTVPPDSRVFIHTIPNCSMGGTDITSFEEQFGQHLKQVVLQIPQQGGPTSEGFLRDKLQTASRWGAMVAIDDYGVNDTGETMLSALSPQMVKIGMSVIRGIESDQERQQMISAIIGFCRERGIEVVAEGVETREEMEALVACGVDYLQGYYISLPSMPPLMPGREILSQVWEAKESVCYKNVTVPHKIVTYFDIPK
jgi:EAL domain-containing protein (putative c-di-GMP-specific phosphodiesterase class I)